MIDFILDENNVLRTKDGDLVIGESDLQHQNLLLILDKGSLKEHPTACVGLAKFLESESPDAMLREIRTQFVNDGLKVNALSYKNGKLTVDANYQS